MKIFFGIFCILAGMTYSGILFSQSGTRNISSDRLASFIQNNMELYHICGLSASVVVDDQVVWKGNFGMADVEKGIPVTDSTIFLLYSLTKSFTGVALMQLVETGLLNPDVSVNQYLPFPVIHPDFPEIPITPRMLMSHVAGIRDNWTVINSLMNYGEDTSVPLDSFLIQYFTPGGIWYGENSSFTSYAPGTHFEYSNAGASLAGYLVEAVTGQEFTHYCQEHLFSALNMPRSSFHLTGFDTNQLAMPHAFTGNGYMPTGHITHPMLPAGFVRTSRNQLDHFLLAMMEWGSYQGVQVLDSISVNEMTTPQYPAVEPTTGLLIGFDPGNNVWGHTGGLNGVKTAMFFNQEENWGINLLSNGSGEPWQIIFMLYQYAREYLPVSALNLWMEEETGNGIIEPDETALIGCSLRNNFLESYDRVTAVLSVTDASVELINPEVTFGTISPGDTVVCQGEPFTFRTANILQPHPVTFFLDIYTNGLMIARDSFDLYFGLPHVLLVNDETSLYRNMVNTSAYYQSALEKTNLRIHCLDLNKWTLPAIQEIAGCDAVIWFTGLSGGRVLSEEELSLLQQYLDQGGNLFLSGQHIADDTLATGFLRSYLHVSDAGNWSGPNLITGCEHSFLGKGITCALEGGSGSGTQIAPNQIKPENGGEVVFYYSADTLSIASVSFSGHYKTVFTGFGFEGIAEEANRDTLMQRIIRWFGPMTGTREMLPDSDSIRIEVKIFPNPAIRDLNLILTRHYREPLCIRIVDSLGKLITMQPWVNPMLPATVDIRSFLPGVYLVTITGRNIHLEGKWIK